MLAELQNEYGSDQLILMRGRGGGREDVFGSGVVSSAARSCLSIRLLYKMYYSIYPCLGYFFPGKIGSWIFFLQKPSRPPQQKSNGRSLKKKKKKKKTEKVSDW